MVKEHTVTMPVSMWDRKEAEIAELKEDIKSKDECIDDFGKYFRPKIKKMCNSCNKEFELKMRGEYAAMRQTISNFENCPHCGVRNDTWIMVEWLDKQSLANSQADAIEKIADKWEKGLEDIDVGKPEVTTAIEMVRFEAEQLRKSKCKNQS